MSDANLCPMEIRQSLRIYVENGAPPGGFLQAVLANNLMNAVARADLQNQHLLPHIVSFVFTHVPSACWGSKEKVDAWIKKFRDENPGYTLRGVDKDNNPLP